MSVENLVAQLEDANKLKSSVLHLKAMMEPIREAEKLLRAADALASQEGQFSAYTSRLLEATDALGAAAASRHSSSDLMACNTDQTVAGLHQSFTERFDAAKQWLHTSVTSQTQSLLSLCNWPPRLTGDPASSQPSTPMRRTPAKPGPPSTPQRSPFRPGTPGTPMTPSTPQSTAPPPSTRPFDGEGAQEALPKLRKLLVVLTSMQAREQAASEQPREDGEPAPVMWFAMQLAEPLGARLEEQFAADLPTGRLDHPEWLLSTALRLARQYSPLVDDLFQGAVEAAGLGAQYNMALEFPRALREVVKGVLERVRLPAVAEQAAALQHALWPLYVDAMLQYEAKMAPLMGLLVKDPQDLRPAMLRGSCLDLMCSNTAWLDAWAEAERAAQQTAVDEALYSDEGWAPAAGPGGLLDDEGLSVPPWQREFYPTAGAERVAGLVEDCLVRARCIPRAAAQQRFIAAVAGDLLQVACGRMLRIQQQADNFRDILSPHWAPKVCACICAAHYLEHQLTEIPTSPLAVYLLPTPATPDGRPSKPLFAKQTASFSTLRRERTLKVAKHAAKLLANGLIPYQEAKEAFASLPLHVEDPVPSSKLMRAVEEARAVLLRLSGALDSAAFRDVWKNVAVAADRVLFDIAIVTTFSPGGVQQFRADCAASMAAFAPFTAKPAAHFRNVCSVLRILLLDSEAAAEVAARINEAYHKQDFAEFRRVAKSVAGAGSLTERQVYRLLTATKTC